jgi:rare lipoprotein A
MKKIICILFAFNFCFLFSYGNIHLQDTIPKKISTHKTKTKISVDTSAEAKVVKYGIASFYAKKFIGRKTSTGARYSSTIFTAACNVLPLGTWVKVTNLRNKKTVVVEINDHLHRKNKRLIDLSRCAAEKLGYISRGTTKVKVEVLRYKKVKRKKK